MLKVCNNLYGMCEKIPSLKREEKSFAHITLMNCSIIHLHKLTNLLSPSDT